MVWIGLGRGWDRGDRASYLFADRAVSLWCLHHPSRGTPHLVGRVPAIGKADVPIWLLAVWSCIANRWRPTLVTIVALVVVGVSVCPLKAMARRARPNTMPEAARAIPAQDPHPPWQKRVSFPSGDTALPLPPRRPCPSP